MVARLRSGALLTVALAMAVAITSASAATLVGSKRANSLVGTKGADRLVGKAGADRLKGLAGRDVLVGGRGPDLLIGGRGADVISGGPGADRIKAADGLRDRRIDGGRGANVCSVDIPLDLAVSTNCAAIRPGVVPIIGGPGAGPDPNALEITSAQGLLCLDLLGCVFTITGKGADSLLGHVTPSGAVTSAMNVAVNALVTGTWLATGTYKCAPGGGTGYLTVTIGTKSSPPVPVDCN
jgi:serralysin